MSDLLKRSGNDIFRGAIVRVKKSLFSKENAEKTKKPSETLMRPFFVNFFTSCTWPVGYKNYLFY